MMIALVVLGILCSFFYWSPGMGPYFIVIAALCHLTLIVLAAYGLIREENTYETHQS
jgi:hypothetical protein